MSAAVYVVRKGDTLSGIAFRHGWPDWRQLYDAQPHSFRASRPDPDLIHPGDRILVSVRPARRSATTGRRFIATRPAPTVRLKVRLVDIDWDRPLAGLLCTIRPQPSAESAVDARTSTTSDDGLLDLSIPASWTSVLVEVSPPVSLGLPNHLEFVCHLGIGFAPAERLPEDDAEAWLSRLHNLGAFAPEEMISSGDPAARASLVAIGLAGTTACSPPDMALASWDALVRRYGR